MAGNFSLLTKTYAGDFTAFERLCESIDRLMPDTFHHVLVDRADKALFNQFEGPARSVLVCEDILPNFHPFELLGRRFWRHRLHYPVRGWIFQQLAKLKAASLLQERAVVLVDSDVLFLRPLEQEQVMYGDRVKLYHRPGAQSGPASQSDKWHDAASCALGLDPRGYTGADYISTVIAWSPEVVRQMLNRIEQANGRAWPDVLLRNFRFSECVLYGVFCDHCEGPHQELVSPTMEVLCHWCWPYDLSDPDGVARFVEDYGRETVAALVQSNLGLSDQRRGEIYNLLKAKVKLEEELPEAPY